MGLKGVWGWTKLAQRQKGFPLLAWRNSTARSANQLSEEAGREIEAFALNAAGVAAEFFAVFRGEGVMVGLLVEAVVETVAAGLVDEVHFADGVGGGKGSEACPNA